MIGSFKLTHLIYPVVTNIFLVVLLALSATALSAEPDDNDAANAKSLADMLRAARQVISSNQNLINDPNLGDKGLSGQIVLQKAIELYKKNTGTDPATHISAVQAVLDAGATPFMHFGQRDPTAAIDFYRTQVLPKLH